MRQRPGNVIKLMKQQKPWIPADPREERAVGLSRPVGRGSCLGHRCSASGNERENEAPVDQSFTGVLGIPGGVSCRKF